MSYGSILPTPFGVAITGNEASGVIEAVLKVG